MYFICERFSLGELMNVFICMMNFQIIVVFGVVQEVINFFVLLLKGMYLLMLIKKYVFYFQKMVI